MTPEYVLKVDSWSVYGCLAASQWLVGRCTGFFCHGMLSGARDSQVKEAIEVCLSKRMIVKDILNTLERMGFERRRCAFSKFLMPSLVPFTDRLTPGSCYFFSIHDTGELFFLAVSHVVFPKTHNRTGKLTFRPGDGFAVFLKLRQQNKAFFESYDEEVYNAIRCGLGPGMLLKNAGVPPLMFSTLSWRICLSVETWKCVFHLLYIFSILNGFCGEGGRSEDLIGA
jgi:hypothetical protein